ncbi:MAG: hypothetical protein WD602_11035 [Actinomycetota bacterium]
MSPNAQNEGNQITASCGKGRFYREDNGVWRYGPGGRAVFGGQDMTLTNFFDFPRGVTDQGEVVHVARGLAMEDKLLSWCLEWDRGAPTIDVPVAEWDRRDEVIGIWAPELQHEGGIRGMKFDSLQDQSDSIYANVPIAPNRPPPDRVRGFTLLERDLRRKTKAAEPIRVKKKNWVPWWDRPRRDGTF